FLLSAEGGAPVAFTGDLAFHGTHPYTADGHSAQWLAVLDMLAGDLASVATLYPGHGDPAGPGVLAEQRRYLLYYREVVRRLSGGQAKLPPSARAELAAAMQAFLPRAPLTWVIGLGADAVASEQAAADPAAGRSRPWIFRSPAGGRLLPAPARGSARRSPAGWRPRAPRSPCTAAGRRLSTPWSRRSRPPAARPAGLWPTRPTGANARGSAPGGGPAEGPACSATPA